MRSSRSRADADIKRLFPEIDVDYPPMSPRWPGALWMTMFLTPLNFGSNPVPAEVLYSWKLYAQRTRMFWPADSPIAKEDALMLATHGYSVTQQRAVPELPGTPCPNWRGEAPCSCEALIGAATSLTPYGPVQILRCPATLPRLFGRDTRPMTFLVTPSRGGDPTAPDHTRRLLLPGSRVRFRRVRIRETSAMRKWIHRVTGQALSPRRTAA
jgi:hypothetical protein